MRIYILVLILLCSSCFLSRKFAENGFAYTENGVAHSVSSIVAKGYNRSEIKKDSSGNEEQFYYYPDGSFLYFVHVSDSAKQYQPVNESENVPREIYNARYFKGIDSTNRYWRETRFKHFKAGYRFASEEKNWQFDSCINYFTLHLNQ